MKVNNSKIRDSVAGLEGAKAGKIGAQGLNKKEKTDAKALNASGDFAKVNISKNAQDAKRVQELATPNLDSIDEAKVAKFQKLIDDGKYNVDAEALADRIVTEHLIS